MINRTVNQVLKEKGYELFSVHPSDLVLDGLEQMAQRNIGALAVLEDGQLVGVLTERDYARNGELAGRTASTTSVGEIMTRHVATVRSDQTIDQCLGLMTKHRVRHLPVFDDDLVGMISIGDVGKAIMSEQGHLIDDLTNFITGSPR